VIESLNLKFITDTSRLPEIFDFRVKAYENSAYSKIVNRTLFPDGWSDEADQFSFHWILTNVEDVIVASARLTYFETVEQLASIDIDISQFNLSVSKPFALISRLVVDKTLRNHGISKLFDTVRIDKMKKDNIPMCFAEARQERIKSLENLDFGIVGSINFRANPDGAGESLTLMVWKNKNCVHDV